MTDELKHFREARAEIIRLLGETVGNANRTVSSIAEALTDPQLESQLSWLEGALKVKASVEEGASALGHHARALREAEHPEMFDLLSSEERSAQANLIAGWKANLDHVIDALADFVQVLRRVRERAEDLGDVTSAAVISDVLRPLLQRQLVLRQFLEPVSRTGVDPRGPR